MTPETLSHELESEHQALSLESLSHALILPAYSLYANSRHMLPASPVLLANVIPATQMFRNELPV